MSTAIEFKEEIEIANAPDIAGLLFRGFRGKSDYPLMLEIINAIKGPDKSERSETVEDIARGYAHLERCDPYQDMLFAEVNGEAVGYSRVWWDKELNGPYTYTYFVFLKPDWRASGIGEAMNAYLQDRLRQIAAQHPDEDEKFLQVFAASTEKWNIQLFLNDGYQPVRYGLSMVRPCDQPIEISPLPEGIEVRPVREDQLRQLWDAGQEAFRDHWGFVPEGEEAYQDWLEWPDRQPELFMVAWDGDEIVGQIQNFIAEKENKEYNRLRGYTENISVRRLWRRQGVARALLTRSIKMFQEMGMDETSLGVDTQNPNGAKGLYVGVGYQEVKRFTTYRKLLSQGSNQ